MSVSLFGEIDTYPWLTVTVQASQGAQGIRFVVDTGFYGELAIPRSLTSLFGRSNDSLEIDFANGQHENAEIVECRVEWTDGFRDVTAMYIDGINPLLGMELLKDCLMTLEIEGNGGQFTIEAL